MGPWSVLASLPHVVPLCFSLRDIEWIGNAVVKSSARCTADIFSAARRVRCLVLRASGRLDVEKKQKYVALGFVSTDEEDSAEINRSS